MGTGSRWNKMIVVGLHTSNASFHTSNASIMLLGFTDFNDGQSEVTLIYP
jgi:hypothetical protein